MSEIYLYSAAVFTIILVSACALNLLKNHYIFQLAGIAFCFTCFIIKSMALLGSKPDISVRKFFFQSLPFFTGISACLISMVFGFWLFPAVRRKFKG